MMIDDFLQSHGAYEYTNEFRIWPHASRRACVARIYGGSNEIMKLLVARSL